MISQAVAGWLYMGLMFVHMHGANRLVQWSKDRHAAVCEQHRLELTPEGGPNDKHRAAHRTVIRRYELMMVLWIAVLVAIVWTVVDETFGL